MRLLCSARQSDLSARPVPVLCVFHLQEFPSAWFTPRAAARTATSRPLRARANIRKRRCSRRPASARPSSRASPRSAASAEARTRQETRADSRSSTTRRREFGQTRADGGGQRGWSSEVTGALLLRPRCHHSRPPLFDHCPPRARFDCRDMGEINKLQHRRRRINGGGAVASGGEKVAHFLFFALVAGLPPKSMINCVEILGSFANG